MYKKANDYEAQGIPVLVSPPFLINGDTQWVEIHKVIDSDKFQTAYDADTFPLKIRTTHVCFCDLTRVREYDPSTGFFMEKEVELDLDGGSDSSLSGGSTLNS